MHSEFHVLLVGNYVSDHQESMQRFAALLASGLNERKASVELIAAAPIFGRLRRGTHGVGKWLGYLDKFLLFPRWLRRKVSVRRKKGRVLVHICDHSNSPFVSALRGVPHLVTVHDLLAVRSALGEFPQNPTRYTGRVLQRMILNGMKRCQFAVCVSEATRLDFLRLTGRPERDTKKIPQALNYPYAPVSRSSAEVVLRKLFERSEMQPIDQPYFLHVGGNSWYKNRAGVLELWRALQQAPRPRETVLLMAGTPPTVSLRKLAGELGIERQVYWIGKVSNEELQALYSTAEALIFPSWAEGYGWPPLEAQACGCLVIASHRASLPEVAGDGALFIDPADPQSGAQAVRRILQMSTEESDELRRKGFENVQRVSVSKMIAEYWLTYEELLAGQSE